MLSVRKKPTWQKLLITYTFWRLVSAALEVDDDGQKEDNHSDNDNEEDQGYVITQQRS